MSSIFGTIIALGMVAFACFLAIRSMIRDKRAGKSLSCGCDCKHCSGACHMCSPEEQAGTLFIDNQEESTDIMIHIRVRESYFLTLSV